MEITNVFLKDKMKIGVIGISGKGKSTLLNHLISKEIACKLQGLIGSSPKEVNVSGQTKNPVRYCIKLNASECSCDVSQWKNEKIENFNIELEKVEYYAKSTSEKCTIRIVVGPSEEFSAVMNKYSLTELEFIDTQGLLDTLDEEVSVPLEIKECTVLLYLYDDKDQGNRGDYIRKYRNFLNSISDKPLIFLEMNTQWQIRNSDILALSENAEEALNDLDKDYPTSPKAIIDRYKILTQNNEIKNNDAYILTSVLSASESSANYYEVKLPKGQEEHFDECLRICASHTLSNVFKRLSGIRESIQNEFDKVNGKFNYKVSFKACYDLLDDVFIKKYRRIDVDSKAKILCHARNDPEQFVKALVAFHRGDLFNPDLSKEVRQIHTSHGYYCEYETYEDQDVLDCMQLLLDLYKGYLARINNNGNYLSKAIQVYLSQTISSDYICRSTGYPIPVLDEKTFIECMKNLQKWIGNLSVERVEFKRYDEFDSNFNSKKKLIGKIHADITNARSLISKLVYSSQIINGIIYNLAIDNILSEKSAM